jgi:putative inorganic carbon (hco3(-)) transporter
VATAPSGPGGPASRPEIWSAALCAIQDFPLTGIGMGTFGEVTPAMYPLFAGYLPQGHAHNVFLQVAVDLGIPGLVAWLAILVLALVSAWELYRQTNKQGDRWAAGLGAGLLCAQVALGVHGMVDVAAWRTPLGGMVWVLWGLTLAARNVYGESTIEGAAECTHVEKG